MRCALCWVALWLLLLPPLARGAEAESWVELTTPSVRDGVQADRWIEVHGRARERTRDVPYDIVIALDVSESSFRPAGFDVDGDGVVGRLTERGVSRLQLTDREDSIAHAALRLARSFVERIDAGRGRVALLTFDGRSRVQASLAGPGETADALAGVKLYARRGGTHLAGAVRRATEMLSPATEGARQRSILLLSDGQPTAPGSRQTAARYALHSAAEAGRAGIRVFGVSPERGEAPLSSVLVQMAQLSGGETFRSDLPEEWLRRLEPSRPLEIESASLINQRTGQPGRAVRWFPDGSFDGYVELARGRNVLQARVELTEGRVLESELVIRYVPSLRSRGTETLLQTLRKRTVETELAGAARGIAPSPAARERSVRIEPE